MASNSFRLKGWTVLIAAVMVWLIVVDNKAELAYIGILPIAVLWGLDAHFLRQERLYRGLFDKVRHQDPADIDFSMKPNTSPIGEIPEQSWWWAFWSVTLVPFYLAFYAMIVVAVIVTTTTN